MTEKRSWFCSGLPRLWWWLLALLGLPLLFFLMISDRQIPVEEDIDHRVRTSLLNNEINWAEVSLEHRGRDVMLTGSAPSEDERDRAIQLAGDVYGVNIVEHDIAVLPMNSPELSVQTQDGKIVLQGLLPSQGHIDKTIEAANTAFGADNISNQLSVGERLNESEWLGKIAGFLPALANWKSATLEMNDEGSKLSGVARSDDEKGELLVQAKKLLGGTIEDAIEVKPLQAANLSTQVQNGKLTLTGLLPSQQAIDNIVKAATQRMGDDNVINQLKNNADVAEADWLEQATQLISQLPNTDSEATLPAGKLTLNGEVSGYQAHLAAVAKANAAISGSKLSLTDNLVVKAVPQPEAMFAVLQADQAEEPKAPPPPPKPTQAASLETQLSADKLILKGMLPTQEAADQLVAAANQRVGQENVVNQLTISPDVMQADWLELGVQLISQLPKTDSQATLPSGSLALTGEVTGYQAHLAAIAQGQIAIKGTELSLLDRLKINTLPQPTAQFAVVAPDPEPEPTPKSSAEVIAAMDEGKLTLSGTLETQEEIDALIVTAQHRAGAENVENQLQIDAGRKPAEWLGYAQRLINGLLGDGTLFMNDEKAILTGSADGPSMYMEAATKAHEIMEDSDIEFAERLTAKDAFNDPPTPEELALQNCQSRLDETMQGQSILFATNKADIKQESNKLLDSLASIVKECADSLSGKVVSVNGHTDNRGDATYNMELSQRRADAVRAYLENAGIATDLLLAKGYGEEQPVANNDTEEGRAQNRRITFEIKGK